MSGTTHHRKSLPLPLLVFALSALSAPGCSKKSGGPAAVPPPPEVQVLKVEARELPINGEWVGATDGMVNAQIKSQVSGYLLRQNYREGSFVRRGQLMFEVDPAPFQAALSQAQGQLAQARGQLLHAQTAVQQARAGFAQARSQLTQAQAVRQQAASQMLQSQAQRAQAQANLGKTQLDVRRYQPLAEKKAVTQQELDNAVQADLAAKAQLQAAEAQIKNAEATIAAASAQVGNAQAAIEVARAQVAAAEAGIVQAEAQVQTAQAQVETAQVNLGYTRITSPIDGIAGIAKAQVGDLLSPAAPEPLTTVSTVDPIKVNFTVSEQEFLQGSKLVPVEGTRPVRLQDRKFELIQADGSVYSRPGKFFAEDRNLAPTTGALKLTAVFPNPGRSLRPGQYARVRAIRYVEKDAILIPQRAVNELQDSMLVAVVEADNKVAMRKVKLGERLGDQWVVREGLKSGETIIVEGLQKVGPGAQVKPKPFESATPTPTSTPAKAGV